MTYTGDETFLRDVMTLADAAAQEGLSHQVIRMAANRGYLRARRIGNPPHPVWITTQAALAEWVAHRAAKRVGPKPRRGKGPGAGIKKGNPPFFQRRQESRSDDGYEVAPD